MPVLTDQLIVQGGDRTYHVHVPANPAQATVPAIVVFHGGGQDAATIARRWGLEPGNPVPANVADYLLVFPEADPRLSGEWVHFQKSDSSFPTYDLEFVDLLVQELTTRLYATGSAVVPDVSADPALIYAAGFSNGGGMVWQLINSDRVALFRGFPPSVWPSTRRRRSATAVSSPPPAANPLPFPSPTSTAPATTRSAPGDAAGGSDRHDPARLHGPRVAQAQRNPAGRPAAATTLIPGSANLTEVVVELYVGAEAFSCATVINGGHNWPTPSTVGNPRWRRTSMRLARSSTSGTPTPHCREFAQTDLGVFGYRGRFN